MCGMLWGGSTMKRILGWIFLLVGIGVVCLGVYLALSPVIETYAAALDDPMKDTPVTAQGGANQEEGTVLSHKMIKGVLIGALGLPLTITGSVLLGVSFVQRMRKKFESRSAKQT